MAGLIYTAVFGNYDTPKPIRMKERGVDYRMFTDGPGAAGWDVVKVPGKRKDFRRAARACKVLTPSNPPFGPHPKEYDWFLWIDGTMEITGKVAKKAKKWLKHHDFAAWRHPWWQCSYTEIDKCIKMRKDDPRRLELARKHLKQMGLPKNYGQLATWALLRKNTDLMKQHAAMWWASMDALTMRDQVTFMLNLWKLKAGIEWMDESAAKNSWLKFHIGHKR